MFRSFPAIGGTRAKGLTKISRVITLILMESEPYIQIAVLDNFFEAQLLESILKERSIPHHLRSYHDTAYDGLFQVQKGWGEIRGPRNRKAHILDLLEDIRKHNQSES